MESLRDHQLRINGNGNHASMNIRQDAIVGNFKELGKNSFRLSLYLSDMFV